MYLSNSNPQYHLPTQLTCANIRRLHLSGGLLAEPEKEALIQVRKLTVHYTSADGREIPALKQVDFTIQPGEAVGVLGESGCGKTTLGLSVLRLLPASARIASGSVLFHGQEILKMTEDQLQKLRGAEISMIFQEPEIALNPVMRVGEQIAEVIRAHRPGSREQCRAEAKELLNQLGFSDAERIYSAYPHQLSGGQRQRAVIAQAIACKPSFVIADEPTTALDPTVQGEILALLRHLKERHHMGSLIITHNPAILARITDRVLVMYAGRIVEEAATSDIFRKPLHPYTLGLLRCHPQFDGEGSFGRRKPLHSIPGRPPEPTQAIPGCSFEPRCPDRMDRCTTGEPEEVQAETSLRVRCFKYGG
jgi:oligopeptide/dipeptide ABC transporter ATP-binding protein